MTDLNVGQIYAAMFEIYNKYCCKKLTNIQQLRDLIELNFSHSPINDDEYKIISDFLNIDNNIISVNFNYNRISDTAIKFIAAALATNHTIAEVNLRDSLIKNSGLNNVAEALKKNSNITYVDLKFCNWTIDKTPILNVLKQHEYLVIEISNSSKIIDAMITDLNVKHKQNHTLMQNKFLNIVQLICSADITPIINRSKIVALLDEHLTTSDIKNLIKIKSLFTKNVVTQDKLAVIQVLINLFNEYEERAANQLYYEKLAVNGQLTKDGHHLIKQLRELKVFDEMDSANESTSAVDISAENIDSITDSSTFNLTGDIH